ncbi:hypothetical protein ACBI99_25430 [Nonomuraea sp. ATR24]|uniref:hypothetical protein n=1 Tax=unclassified Nonomuraea TaxID=2593643 RepID=UPI0033EBC354
MIDPWVHLNDRCLSPHPAPVRADCVAIEWWPGRPLITSVRVRDFTCDCEKTYYELCQIGGMRFIRWIRIRRSGLISDECLPGRAAEIDDLWARLLLGAAR